MMIRSQFPIMFNDFYGFRLQFANKQALKFAAKFIYPLVGSHSIRSSNWLIMATSREYLDTPNTQLTPPY